MWELWIQAWLYFSVATDHRLVSFNWAHWLFEMVLLIDSLVHRRTSMTSILLHHSPRHLIHRFLIFTLPWPHLLSASLLPLNFIDGPNLKHLSHHPYQRIVGIHPSSFLQLNFGHKQIINTSIPFWHEFIFYLLHQVERLLIILEILRLLLFVIGLRRADAGALHFAFCFVVAFLSISLVLVWQLEDVGEVVPLASVGDWSKGVDACCHHSISGWFVVSILPAGQSAPAGDATTWEVGRYTSVGLTPRYHSWVGLCLIQQARRLILGLGHLAHRLLVIQTLQIYMLMLRRLPEQEFMLLVLQLLKLFFILLYELRLLLPVCSAQGLEHGGYAETQLQRNSAFSILLV